MSLNAMRCRIRNSVTQNLDDDPDYNQYLSMQQRCKSESDVTTLTSAMNSMSTKSTKTDINSQYNSIRESGRFKGIAIRSGCGIRDSGQFKLNRASSKCGPTVDSIRDHLAYQTLASDKIRRRTSVGNIV